MSKEQIKKIIVMGIGCTILLIVGIIYSILFNDSRWVKEMNMTEYVFSIKDVPMLVVGLLIGIYAVYIVITVFKVAFSKKNSQNYTRRIPPFLGVFGLFGFLGFLGFWTYSEYGIIYPFLFFNLFGLFGLFFEGKLSNTLKDELFQENKIRADLKSYKTGFVLLVFIILLSKWRGFAHNTEWYTIFMIISVSLIIAFVLFQKNYLLYRYEKEE